MRTLFILGSISLAAAQTCSESPIFVVGPPDSGTTLLRVVLGTHPNIYSSFETRFFNGGPPYPGQWADLGTEVGNRTLLQELLRDYENRPADLLSTIMCRSTLSKGKSRWVEKTPNHVHYVPSIMELFPSARIVLAVRAPLDVLASRIRRFHRTAGGMHTIPRECDRNKMLPEQLELVVLEFGSAMQVAHRSEPRVFIVPHDDIVADPEATLRELLDFLHEPWDPRVLRHQEQRPRAHPVSQRSDIALDHTNLRQQQMLEPISRRPKSSSIDLAKFCPAFFDTASQRLETASFWYSSLLKS